MSEYNPFDEGNDGFKPPQKPKKEPIDIKAVMAEIKDLESEVQKLTDKYIKDIEKAVEEKSKEILTV